MEGQSLLRPSEINEIPILAVNRWERKTLTEDEEIPRESIMGNLTPHYLFGRLTGIFCDTALTYRLRANRIVRKKVAGHTGDCSESFVPNNEEFKQMIIDHFRKRRYDVTFLIDSK